MDRDPLDWEGIKRLFMHSGMSLVRIGATRERMNDRRPRQSIRSGRGNEAAGTWSTARRSSGPNPGSCLRSMRVYLTLRSGLERCKLHRFKGRDANLMDRRAGNKRLSVVRRHPISWLTAMETLSYG